LTEVDNGYGAKTSITYVSAKQFTDNPVPFPEIVVSAVTTSGTQNLGGTLAGTRYAYDKAELVFDSALDRFSFPGYGRVVALRLTGGGNDPSEPAPIAGQAFITDTWPLTPFTSSLTKQERWVRRQRVGRVRDVLTLRGSGVTDPWSLLDVSTSDPRLIGGTHYEWDAKLYEVPLSPAENVFDCLEMFFPLDYQRSVANNIGTTIDACRAHGFGFPASEYAWRGDAPPPSGDNIQTRSRTLAVDDFGRATLVAYDNDVFRSDDDICVENTFATPNTGFPRVLSALTLRRFFRCDALDITLASESFIYDGLPAGTVSNGWVTSHNVDRRATDNGMLLNTVHRFDATYDAIGKLASVQTQRDGAARTVTFDYDAFGLVPTHTKREATGVPSVATSFEYDLVSLQPVRSTDSNQTKRGIDFDGFGRPIHATVTPHGGSLGVLSTKRYLGFGGTDPAGRRIEVKSFSDPVAPASVATAGGRTATVFLDELGRARRSEFALGSDYANEVLVVGLRVYDEAGRVVFAADPYPKSQNSASAYGTSYHFKDTGDLNCLIRGRGRQPLNMVTDLATERLPTCLQRSFAGNVDTLDVRDAASLEASSPQAGVVKRRIATAIGRVTERAAFKGGLWLEFATFGYDPLGQLTTMVRFGDPAGLTKDVQWSWQVDSLGEILQSAEPDTATRSFSYSDWGEPIEARWLDGGIERRLVRRYDALGRLTATEERNDGITDPETVTTYAYDTRITVSPLVTPTFVLGRLTRATSPSGEVAFSYDAFGRMNARVFTDNDGGVYIEKTTRSADGRLIALEFNLPDQNHQKELVKYTYDSAGGLRGMTYADASAGREIYRAENIDPFGRVRKAIMGGHVDFLADYANEGRRLIRSASVESPMGARRVIFEQCDPAGRELSRREIKDGATTTTKVTYDALGRLRDVMKVEGGTTLPLWAYGYDPLGNLHVLRHFPESTPNASLSYHQVGDRDRVCRIGYGPGLGGTTCNVVYDGVGNTIEQATRTGTRRLDYFASGSVRRITEGAAQASFRYDPFGAMQELDVIGVGVTDTRHDRHYGRLIERRDLVANGTPKTFIFRHVPGPGGIVATRRGATPDWIFGFGELRGNRFFTNQDGAFVQEVGYEPFGEAKSSGASPGTPDYTSYQWNGGDALAAFTLSHLGARLYDPVIGRFLSRDPLTVFGTATSSNPYAFAANDPLNGADPSGLQCTGSQGSGLSVCQYYQTPNAAEAVISIGVGVVGAIAWVLHHAHHAGSLLLGVATTPSAAEIERIEDFKHFATRLDVPIPESVDLQAQLRNAAERGADRVTLLKEISRLPASIDAYDALVERDKAFWRKAGYGTAMVALTVASFGAAFGVEAGVGLEYLGARFAASRAAPLFNAGARFLGWGRAAAAPLGAAAGATGQQFEEVPEGVLSEVWGGSGAGGGWTGRRWTLNYTAEYEREQLPFQDQLSPNEPRLRELDQMYGFLTRNPYIYNGSGPWGYRVETPGLRIDYSIQSSTGTVTIGDILFYFSQR
jgi:RHS repeat-associated protein